MNQNEMFGDFEQQVETPGQILRRAIELYEPTHIFGMFSGGDDSLTALSVAAKEIGLDMFDGMVRIDTGIKLLEIVEHVPNVCKQLGWDLKEYRAKDCGQDYEALVLEYGFPGPDHHTKMFNRLKERAIRTLIRDHPGGNIMLVSGLRQQESGRRMRLKSEPVQKEGRKVWAAPLFYWNNDQVREYRSTVLAHVPKNPAKEFLCMSGECLCGAYARKGELAQIETFFPETGRYLRDLERRVRERGLPWGWEEAPPGWWLALRNAEKAGQQDWFDDETEEAIGMLCSSCQFKKETEEVEEVMYVD